MAQVASAPAIDRRHTQGRALQWLRDRLATTPGRLVAVSLVVGVVAVSFGTATWISVRSRQRAAQAVRSRTEPLLAQAADLYTSLSGANATATTTFLTGGIEPAARRKRYLADIQAATVSLSSLTRQVGDSAQARTAVATISGELPIYTGLVETARANNRQGFPVGAAYMRAASNVLSASILRAADRLYRIEAQRLSDRYGSGTSATTLIVFVIAAVTSLVLLVGTQLYVASISHRTLNIPLLAATGSLLALSIWGLIGLVGEQNALARAQRDGSDPVQVLSAARVLASRVQGDESLVLVNRGSDTQDARDETAVEKQLGPLLTEAAKLDRRTGTSAAARALASDFADYAAEQAEIARLEQAGRIPDAIKLDVATESGAHSPADRINANLVAQSGSAQRRFERSAADATSALGGLSIAIPILTVLCAALALLGLGQRINEYR